MSSAGCIILLAAPVVAIVATLDPSLLLLPPGVFVVGGALIVAPEKLYVCKMLYVWLKNTQKEINIIAG